MFCSHDLVRSSDSSLIFTVRLILLPCLSPYASATCFLSRTALLQLSSFVLPPIHETTYSCISRLIFFFGGRTGTPTNMRVQVFSCANVPRAICYLVSSNVQHLALGARSTTTKRSSFPYKVPLSSSKAGKTTIKARKRIDLKFSKVLQRIPHFFFYKPLWQELFQLLVPSWQFH